MLSLIGIELSYEKSGSPLWNSEYEGNFYEGIIPSYEGRILLRIYELGVYHESQPLTPEIRGWWPGTAVRSVRTRRTFRHERREIIRKTLTYIYEGTKFY